MSYRMRMQFSLTEVIMLGMFLLACSLICTSEPRLTARGLFSLLFFWRFPTQNVVQGVGWPSGSFFYPNHVKRAIPNSLENR